MSNPVPGSLALSTIADGSPRIAAPVRNNFSAIQTLANAVVTLLSGGTAGQVLTASDASNVEWADATPTQKVAYVTGPKPMETAAVTSTYETANAAILLPFTIQADQTIAEIDFWPGSSQSGNYDLGVYDSSGTRKVSKGSTAQSTLTANSLNKIAVTSTPLDAGLYYLAVVYDNATANLRTLASGDFGNAFCRKVTSSFPLPSTLTIGSTAPTTAPLMAAPLT